MSGLYESILTTVGNTPLVKLTRITAGLDATILVKCEFFNPLGSIKDRIGKAMIEDAERRGLVNKDTVIIEPTSGNTGIALAFVCAVKGYKLIIVMPESMSRERRLLLALLGARLELTPATEGMRGAIARARQLLEQTPNAWMPMQFENPANPEIHRTTTAEEIWRDTGGRVDAVVAGVGTGGTLTGCIRALKPRKPNLKFFAVEPARSPVISGALVGQPVQPQPHAIQGIGAGFIPKTFELFDADGKPQIDGVLTVEDADAIKTARRLAKEEGLLVGISSGANVWAAMQLARKPEFHGKTILTFAPSTGERYLSTALVDEARKLLGM